MITDHIFAAYLLKFYEVGEPLLKTICECTVPSKIVLERFKNDIPEGELGRLKEYAKEVYPDGNDELHWKFIKITHVIGTSL